MTEITLEHIKAEHEKLAVMISQIEADMQKPAFFEWNGKRIPLNHGERYVGSIVCQKSEHSRHLILLPGDMDGNDWQAQMDWAASVGGELPDRVEGALLSATMKDEFKEAWYWTRERHVSGSDCAWGQYFNGGNQDYGNTGSKFRARAVRKLIIE